MGEFGALKLVSQLFKKGQNNGIVQQLAGGWWLFWVGKRSVKFLTAFWPFLHTCQSIINQYPTTKKIMTLTGMQRERERENKRNPFPCVGSGWDHSYEILRWRISSGSTRFLHMNSMNSHLCYCFLLNHGSTAPCGRQSKTKQHQQSCLNNQPSGTVGTCGSALVQTEQNHSSRISKIQ